MTPAPKVLLLESDSALRTALEFSLTLDGIAVEAFASDEEIVARAPSAAADCLVLDYRGDVTNPLAVMTVLRRQGVSLPAIVLATYPSRELEADIEAAGALLIEKPLMCDALADAVRACLDRREAA